MAYPKRYVKKRTQAQVLREANVDTTGLDPEMFETLGSEAARRVGAAGVRLQVRNPLKRKPKK